MPWEKPFSDRKACSKDPRMMKHTRDEAQWNGTPVQGVWRDIRKFALALNDWIMVPDQLLALMQYWGIQSAYLHAKLWELMDPKMTGKMNGLVFCKFLEMMVTDPRFRPDLVRLCYELFDRSSGEHLDLQLVRSVELANPADAQAAKGKKKKSGGLPLTMKSGATYNHVQALLAILPCVVQSNPNVLTFEEFNIAVSDPAAHVFWTAAAPQMLELFCARCGPPHGTVPLLSMRWLATTEPVAAGEVMHDADVILLRQLELAGGENFKKDTKKGKKRDASPKK